jgi:hypothetical protein
VGPHRHTHDCFPLASSDASLADRRGCGGALTFPPFSRPPPPVAAAALHYDLPPPHARFRDEMWEITLGPGIRCRFEEGQMLLYRLVMMLHSIVGYESLQSEFSQISLHFACSLVEHENGVWWGESTGSMLPTRGSSSWRRIWLICRVSLPLKRPGSRVSLLHRLGLQERKTTGRLSPHPPPSSPSYSSWPSLHNGGAFLFHMTFTAVTGTDYCVIIADTRFSIRSQPLQDQIVVSLWVPSKISILPLKSVAFIEIEPIPSKVNENCC